MTISQANEIVAFYKGEYTPQSTIQVAFSALGCAGSDLLYVGIAGTAGKTCVATLEAAILHAADFVTGCFVGGIAPLRERITVGGKPVSAKIYTAAVTALQGAVEADCSLAAAEFLVACRCFAKAGCKFAVMELAEPSYAASFPKMPACAITQIGANALGHSAARELQQACGMLRRGVTVVTSPAQSEETLTTLTEKTKQEACALTVPEFDDFTEKKHRRLQNRMDYGGYEVILPYLGAHASHNAAIAIELALALWRKGADISDEAILRGLTIAENEGSVLPLKYRPAVVADACQSPLQAAAFARWVKAEDYENISLIVGFAKWQRIEDIFSAFETGTVVDPDNPEKNQLPGMSDNAFDKVYAVTPACVDAAAAQEIVTLGKFHFDIVACATLGEALSKAQANQNEAVAICGCPALVQEAKKLVK